MPRGDALQSSELLSRVELEAAGAVLGRFQDQVDSHATARSGFERLFHGRHSVRGVAENNQAVRGASDDFVDHGGCEPYGLAGVGAGPHDLEVTLTPPDGGAGGCAECEREPAATRGLVAGGRPGGEQPARLLGESGRRHGGAEPTG
jgi:hypothetical protein